MDPVMIGDAFRMKTWKHHPNATDWFNYNCPDKNVVGVFVYMGNERRDGTGPRVNLDAVLTGMGWVHREDIPASHKEMISEINSMVDRGLLAGFQGSEQRLREFAEAFEALSSLNSTLSVELAARQANELAARLEGVVIGLGYALKSAEQAGTIEPAIAFIKDKMEAARAEAVEVRADAKKLEAAARKKVLDEAFPSDAAPATQHDGATATGSMSAPSPAVNGTASLLLSHMVEPEPFTAPLEVMEEAPAEPAPIVRTYAQGVLEGMESVERILNEGPDLDTINRKIHQAKTMVRTHIARES